MKFTEMFTCVCVNVNNTLYYLVSSTLHFKYSFHTNHINVNIMSVAHTKSIKFHNVHKLTFISLFFSIFSTPESSELHIFTYFSPSQKSSLTSSSMRCSLILLVNPPVLVSWCGHVSIFHVCVKDGHSYVTNLLGEQCCCK